VAKNARCSLLLAETGAVALAMSKKNISNHRNCQGWRSGTGNMRDKTKVTFLVDYSFLAPMGLW